MAEQRETKTESRRQLSAEMQIVVAMLKAHNDVLKAFLDVPSIPIPFDIHSKLAEDVEAIGQMISEIGSS